MDADAFAALLPMPAPDELLTRLVALSSSTLPRLLSGQNRVAVLDALAGADGPLVASRLLAGAGADVLGAGLALLDAPPLYPGRLLVAVRRSLVGDPAGLDRGLGRLEALYGLLPDDLDARLVCRLGLPRALGAVLDLRVRAGEFGAPLSVDPSGAQMLRLAASRLEVASVFDLAGAGRGGLAGAALPFGPGEVVESAGAMLVLGAPASALRLSVLALLLERPDRVPPMLTRTAHRLLRRRWAMVPPEHVVAVWKLLAVA